MKTLLVVLAIALVIPTYLLASDAALGGIKLLPGYSVKRESTLDASAWTIEKKGGPKIHFEAGPSEGAAADPKDENRYSWYREQLVSGCKVRFALIKPGLKTVWEPDDGTDSEPGNILLVSFLLERERSDYVANFSAKVRNPQELADVLLMVMTFNPSKRTL